WRRAAAISALTIALALGTQRMLKRRALIRKLQAVETLGSVNVICSDKTGTLTETRMTVTVLDAAGHRFEVQPETSPEEAAAASEQTPALGILLTGGALCNDAVLETGDDGRRRAIGDPTEGALVVAAARFGFAKPELESKMPRVGEVGFGSERRRMTTVHQCLGGTVCRLLEIAGSSSPWVAFCKGAVDSVLGISSGVLVGNQVEPLDERVRQQILSANDELAAKGMRVLAVAIKPLAALPEQVSEETIETQMTFIGLVAMLDPARPEVKAAVATCRQAGIRPVMITGDHPLTAQYIARGLAIADAGSKPLTGVELTNASAEELERIAEETTVYARVAPEQKLAIVEALQRRGHIVAMTGDGVNDAPALRKADIGVAMGITGTDVSKEAADMVLLDDNFATIVAAVEEGRVIFDNIRKFLKYTLTSNAGEIWVMLLAPLVGMPMALMPVQILWVNLMTDGLPGLALTAEPAELDTMRRKPYHPSQSILGRGLAVDVIWVGLLLGVVALAAGWFWWQRQSENWQTAIFTVLTLGQMANALATRSERDSFLAAGRRPNYLLYAAVLLTFGLQLAVTYVPLLQRVFHTRPLALSELAACLGLSVVVFCGVEFGKMVRRTVERRQ
ncbi:MAG: cation-transporting P-type ATPase, partial [candidate division WOR-3 bacterium]